jgi:hypothetical protein
MACVFCNSPSWKTRVLERGRAVKSCYECASKYFSELGQDEVWVCGCCQNEYVPDDFSCGSKMTYTNKLDRYISERGYYKTCWRCRCGRAESKAALGDIFI